MKKLLCLMLSLLLLVSAAAADEDNWVESDPIFYVGAIEDLLFSTHNVTLTGEAHFSLDGEWFKTANGVYRQDGKNSYWDYRLTAPGVDGSVRENGYTIVANPDQFYVMESWPHPGTYRNGSDFAGDTVLRKTGQTQTMILALRELANNAYSILDEGTLTPSADENRNETLHIRLDGNTPAMVNLSLTLFWQYAARRFLEVDTEQVDESQSEETLQDYGTTSKYLLAATRYLTVKKADITLKMNNLGQLEQIAGSASVQLRTVLNEDSLLDVVFRLDVTDRGSTKVAEFRPEDYNVVLYQEPAGSGLTPQDEASMARHEALSEHVYFSWSKAGYGDGGMDYYTSGNSRLIGDCYFFKWEGSDSLPYLLAVLDPDGNLMQLRHEDGFDADRQPAPYQDEQLVRDALAKTMAFLQECYPDAAARMEKLELSWWRGQDGRVDFCFEQPAASGEENISVIVRALPEWRIEEVRCETAG